MRKDEKKKKETRELVAHEKNGRGETIVLWCSPTEEGACTLAVWEEKRWLKW